MAGLVNANQLFYRNMCVFLRRGQAFVTQQFLDGSQVSSGTEHVRCKCMPECMRMNFQPLGKAADMTVNNVSDAPPGQSPAPPIQKQAFPRSFSLPRQDRP
jgi:hypothetical protein